MRLHGVFTDFEVIRDNLVGISGSNLLKNFDLPRREGIITGLAEMGLPVTAHVRCISIHEQVAQKLHACTGPQREDRARDVLDILLLDMLGQLDYGRTRAAAERIFTERATHPFPPSAALPVEWRRNWKPWRRSWATERRMRKRSKRNSRLCSRRLQRPS